MPPITPAKPRTTCTCGSSEFYINEGLTHKADTSDDGKLIVYKRDWANEVEGVVCAACDQNYPVEEFDDAELF